MITSLAATKAYAAAQKGLGIDDILEAIGTMTVIELTELIEALNQSRDAISLLQRSVEAVGRDADASVGHNEADPVHARRRSTVRRALDAHAYLAVIGKLESIPHQIHQHLPQRGTLRDVPRLLGEVGAHPTTRLAKPLGDVEHREFGRRSVDGRQHRAPQLDARGTIHRPPQLTSIEQM